MEARHMVNRRAFFEIFFYNRDNRSREMMEAAEGVWRAYMKKYGFENAVFTVGSDKLIIDGEEYDLFLPVEKNENGLIVAEIGFADGSRGTLDIAPRSVEGFGQ